MIRDNSLCQGFEFTFRTIPLEDLGGREVLGSKGLDTVFGGEIFENQHPLTAKYFDLIVFASKISGFPSGSPPIARSERKVKQIMFIQNNIIFE